MTVSPPTWRDRKGRFYPPILITDVRSDDKNVSLSADKASVWGRPFGEGRTRHNKSPNKARLTLSASLPSGAVELTITPFFFQPRAASRTTFPTSGEGKREKSRCLITASRSAHSVTKHFCVCWFECERARDGAFFRIQRLEKGRFQSGLLALRCPGRRITLAAENGHSCVMLLSFLSTGNQRVSVSSLLVCHGLLLVGTNLGVTVALSVPRLQGIPKVTGNPRAPLWHTRMSRKMCGLKGLCLSPGRGMVSLHAHNGPVKFLSVAAAVCNRPPGPSASTPPTSLQPTETDGGDGENPRAPSDSDSAPTAPQGRGVWLGEAGCTSMALQDSLSSSSCGSLAPSQGSLEHGPEDGALYDVLHDPAHHRRGRRASKVDVSSLLVVSGGLGHRRVNRKTKQSRHEDTTSTIFIWQIPLLNM